MPLSGHAAVRIVRMLLNELRLLWALLKLLDSVLVHAGHGLRRHVEVRSKTLIRYHGMGPKYWRGRILVVHAERAALGGDAVRIHSIAHGVGQRARRAERARLLSHIHTYCPYTVYRAVPCTVPYRIPPIPLLPVYRTLARRPMQRCTAQC